MKHIFRYMALILPVVLIFPACKKDFVNLQSTSLIAGDQAYASFNSVQALTASLYSNLGDGGSGSGFEDLRFVVGDEATFESQLSDEAMHSYTWGATANAGPLPPGYFAWWKYDYIRQENDFIAKIPNATNLTPDNRAKFLAEGRFIRAFTYFAMVKRYGGVPIITAVQSPSAPLDSLKVKRNTEQEVYDFIGSEVDAIINDLPEEGGDFHATKYAALALKCRAMLYAASIAKYGQVQLNGLVGIPTSMANTYWQKAIEAANTIISSGKFSLYNVLPDPAANFQQLFNGADPASNPEAIFTEAYSLPSHGHSFDFYNEPQSFKVDYGNVTNPTLELVEQFEYTDGTPGKLKVNDGTGKPIKYSNPADLFKGKDPRFFASILYPNAEWHCNGDPQGSFIGLRRGIVDGADSITAGDLTSTYGTAPNAITITGKDGPMVANDPTKTGFYIKKFMTENAGFVPNQDGPNNSATSYMVFRYGEVLLNLAEASIEMGDEATALSAINQIRTRAGIAQLASVTRDQVRHERQVEMAFENQRWWDLRRWRIADQVLNNTQFHALWPWLNWEANKNPADMKYTFQIVDAPKNPRTFPSALYYEIIDPGEIIKNSNLVQNPEY